MTGKLKQLVSRFDAFDQGFTDKVVRASNPETLSGLLVISAIFGSVWAFAWYGHIVGPWFESLFGLGPYDVDSAGKIRWRRIYSTALCAPVMALAVWRYAYFVLKKHNQK